LNYKLPLPKLRPPLGFTGASPLLVTTGRYTKYIVVPVASIAAEGASVCLSATPRPGIPRTGTAAPCKATVSDPKKSLKPNGLGLLAFGAVSAYLSALPIFTRLFHFHLVLFLTEVTTPVHAVDLLRGVLSVRCSVISTSSNWLLYYPSFSLNSRRVRSQASWAASAL